jgi:hypothetical protein
MPEKTAEAEAVLEKAGGDSEKGGVYEQTGDN